MESKYFGNRIKELVDFLCPRIEVTAWANTPLTLTKGGKSISVTPSSSTIVVTMPERGKWTISTTYNSTIYTKTINCSNAGTLYSINLTN